MPELKVGIQLASLRMPFKKALHTAARLGANAVEIDARGEIRPGDVSQSGLKQIRKSLDDLGLRVSAVGFRTRGGYDVADRLEERIAATKRAIDFAFGLGARFVVNQIGTVPDEPTGPRWQMLTEALTDIGRYGEHGGAFLLAQTGTESGESLARLVSSLTFGGIGVDFDPGNLMIQGFSPLKAVAELGAHIMHVHATDGVRDLARGRGLEVELGRGSVDFPALLGALEEQNYRGYFTIARTNSADSQTEIGQAVEYLRNL